MKVRSFIEEIYTEMVKPDMQFLPGFEINRFGFEGTSRQITDDRGYLRYDNAYVRRYGRMFWAISVGRNVEPTEESISYDSDIIAIAVGHDIQSRKSIFEKVQRDIRATSDFMKSMLIGCADDTIGIATSNSLFSKPLRESFDRYYSGIPQRPERKLEYFDSETKQLTGNRLTTELAKNYADILSTVLTTLV